MLAKRIDFFCFRSSLKINGPLGNEDEKQKTKNCGGKKVFGKKGHKGLAVLQYFRYVQTPYSLTGCSIAYDLPRFFLEQNAIMKSKNDSLSSQLR